MRRQGFGNTLLAVDQINYLPNSRVVRQYGYNGLRHVLTEYLSIALVFDLGGNFSRAFSIQQRSGSQYRVRDSGLFKRAVSEMFCNIIGFDAGAAPGLTVVCMDGTY